MNTIYLLSCCKQKLSHPAKAERLYQSTGFKKSLRYAQSKNADAIFILSAKHHVVALDDVLEPYDVCLSINPIEEPDVWSAKCLAQLESKFNLKEDKFIILAGKEYYKNLVGIGKIENYELPLKGLTQGYRLQWFDEHTLSQEETLCDMIHKYMNELPRYSYTYDLSKLPANGVYICFEKGEKYKNWDRIVRVGTHTGDNNLPSRLEQHFILKNKDRSIFIKNIGRALLNKSHDPFLNDWNIDLTTKSAKEKYASKINMEKLHEIEKQASDYLREHFSFAVLPIDKKEERLAYESFLIKAISSNKDCKPSENWLGLYSPEEKIRKSGMWLKQGLAK
ncbi:MAG: DUF6884 domain-containing protein [Treponema sp.]